MFRQRAETNISSYLSQREIEMKLYHKQGEFFKACLSKKYHTCVFAGGVGSGKSRVLAFTLLYMAISFPETRYLLGRARLSDLRDSTLVTLFDVAKEMKVEVDGEERRVYDFLEYDKQKNIITISQERVDDKGRKKEVTSTIILKALEIKPSDPELIGLGSTEYTACFLDEMGQIDQKVYTTLIQRLRYKLEENNLTGKIIIATNPTQNWLYHQMYIPFENGELDEEIFFIQATPKDNPFLSKSYLKNLSRKNLSEWEYQTRVLLNWHFSEADVELFEVAKINDAFNAKLEKEDKNRFLSVDIAGKGKDATVASIWQGWELLEIRKFNHLTAPETAKIISAIQKEFSISTKHVVIDCNGIGSGVGDLVRGCQRFVAHNSALQKGAFRSIKDQLYYHLSEKFARGEIKLSAYDWIDDIIKELQAHKRYKHGADGSASVTPKSIIHQSLGKSPDIADSLMMRCIYDFINTSPKLELI